MHIHLLVLILTWASAPADPPAVAAAPPAADVTPSPGEAVEIACLYLKDAGACDVAYRRALGSADGEVFARVGCDELKSPRSCVQLGDWWLAARGATKPATEAQLIDVFTRGCSPESPVGCARLLERFRLANANAFGTKVTVDANRVNALVSVICAGAAANEPACATARETQAELAHRSDPTYGACRVDLQIFRDGGLEETHASLPAADQVTPPLVREQCASQCQKWAEQNYVAAEGDTQLRARCRFGDTYLPHAFWRVLNAGTPCASARKSMGSSEEPMFPKCHCERATLRAANDLAEPYGAFVHSQVAFSKRFGSETWYRCAATVAFDDEARAEARCPSSVKQLARRLESEPTLREFKLNLKSLTCADAKR